MGVDPTSQTAEGAQRVRAVRALAGRLRGEARARKTTWKVELRPDWTRMPTSRVPAKTHTPPVTLSVRNAAGGLGRVRRTVPQLVPLTDIEEVKVVSESGLG